MTPEQSEPGTVRESTDDATVRRFRKKPVVIEAFQWLGGDTTILNRTLGQNWGRADAKGVGWDEWDDEDHVVVWNTAEKCWLPVPVGHWIIRGVHGEFYPCASAIFDLTYEEVEADAA